MLESQFETNDFEKTFVYTDKNGLRTNLSKLVSAGKNDPECLCIAKYRGEEDAPVVKVKLYEEEQALLQKLFTL